MTTTRAGRRRSLAVATAWCSPAAAGSAAVQTDALRMSMRQPPTSSTPDVEEQFAHPDGGDVCTSLEFTPELWRSIAGERSISRAIYVDARVELTHRRLLRATADVDYALAEQLVRLLVLVLGTEPPEHADAALVASVREAVLADHQAASGLVPLAEHFGVSPFRLSRAFSRMTGVSLTRYRNRVRVGRALERLEGGDTALAELAAELGFADQAHLTRTMREPAIRPWPSDGCLRPTAATGDRRTQ